MRRRIVLLAEWDCAPLSCTAVLGEFICNFLYGVAQLKVTCFEAVLPTRRIVQCYCSIAAA